MSTLSINQVSVGETVEVYLEETRRISLYEKTETTISALMGKIDDGDLYLLAWKNEPATTNWWALTPRRLDDDIELYDQGYRYAWWVTGRTLIASRSGAVSGPLKCSKCGNFNEYAAPNQPDGTFKCYSCRNS